MPTLLVALADSVAAYIDKGVIKDRANNPRDLFDEIHVLEPSDLGECPPMARAAFGSARVTFHPVGRVNWWSPRAGPLSRRRAELARQAAAHARPDVIRAYDPLAGGWLARHAARMSRAPWVVSVHTNLDIDTRRTLLRRRRWAGLALHLFTRWRVERPVLREATVVVAAYEFVARYVRAMGRRDVTVIHNRADPREFTPSAAPRPHRTRPVVLTVGSTIPERGLDLAIAAAARIDCDLVVIGHGPEDARLRELARQLGVSDRVRFVGRIPNKEMPPVYRDADMYITVARIGGVAVPVLEAAAAGLPIIGVPPYPGTPPEVVDEIGIVCEPTADSLAAAIGRLSADLVERARLGERARSWAEARPDPESQEADLYRSLM